MRTRVSSVVFTITICVLALAGCSNKGEIQARDTEIASLRQQIGTMEGEMGQLESDYEAAVARAQRLQSDLEEIAAREEALVDRLDRVTILRLPEHALFNSASAALTAEGQRLMSRIGGTLADYPTYEIRVEGHTDNVPLTGGELTNWELSAMRATTVVRHLVDGHGISPERLVAVGYGEHRPMYSNQTRDGRSRNRRVEFHIATPPPVKELGAGVATAD